MTVFFFASHNVENIGIQLIVNFAMKRAYVCRKKNWGFHWHCPLIYVRQTQHLIKLPRCATTRHALFTLALAVYLPIFSSVFSEDGRNAKIDIAWLV